MRYIGSKRPKPERKAKGKIANRENQCSALFRNDFNPHSNLSFAVQGRANIGPAISACGRSYLSSFNIWREPSLIVKKAIGKLRRQFVRIPDSPTIREMGGGVRFEHERLAFLDEGDLRAMLTQSYEIGLCNFIKEQALPGDIVLDVGANVGYISAVAASCVGLSGEVHGFEPLAECYARLLRLRELNPLFNFKFNNFAIGEEEGVLPIAFNPDGDSRNATLVPGKNFPEIREVPVHRLDDYIARHISSPGRIKLIKIDVEGFEFSVLKGLQKFLASFKPPVVCEIKPWELAKLDATLEEFDQFMKELGYTPYLFTQPHKAIRLSGMTEMDVVLFRA